MTAEQTAEAIRDGLGGTRLQSLTFDACLMATIEVGEAVKGVTETMIGAEDITVTPIPWDRITAAAQTPAQREPERFCRLVLDSVQTYRKRPTIETMAFSALRLNADWEILIARIDRLSEALIDALKSEPEAVGRAVLATPRLSLMDETHPYYVGDYYQRDLVAFCQTLQQHVQSPAVRQATVETIEGVARVVIAKATDSSQTMADGLSIYLPTWPVAMDAYAETDFARHTRWDDFLRALHGSGSATDAPLPPPLPLPR
jgi:hypothetical protein